MKHFSWIFYCLVFASFLFSCSASRKKRSSLRKPVLAGNTANGLPLAKPSSLKVPPVFIDTKNIDAADVVDFSKTLIGTKYTYGSAIKENGFDCSGFITYVFNHFNIKVPRVTRDFTNAGVQVSLYDSREGDLILFTGTDTTGWIVGHMGMITENDRGAIRFIHSSSGKSIGVIISSLSKYYATRFVKVIRIFNH